MTSILTNNAASTALAVLENTQAQLTQTQNQISTGKRVNSASDNASYWSIATKLGADSSSLGTVSDALSLGSSTLSTASNGITQAISVVQQIRNLIVSAESPGVDLTTTQSNITQLKNQLQTIASSASFNGQNLLSVDSSVTNYNALTNFVASFSRDSAGNISVGTISVDKSTTALYDANTTGFATSSGSIASHIATTLTALSASAGSPPAGVSGTSSLITTTSTVSNSITLTSYTEDSANAGHYFSNGITINGVNLSNPPVVSESVTAIGTAGQLATGDTVGALTGVTTPNANSATYNTTTKTLTFSVVERDTTTSASVYALHTFTLSNFTPNSSGGIIDTVDATAGTSLKNLDITTVGANLANYASLADKIVSQLTTAGANVGAVQSRITTQQSFVSSLKNSIDTGVGALVDADLDQESTRLQALQTQQQLGVQALSIANQSTQGILSLFRGG